MVSLSYKNQSFDNIELVIFDKDGTVFDIHHYWVSMIRLRSLRLQEVFNLDDDQRILLEESMGVDTDKNILKPEGPVGVKKRSYIVATVVNKLASFSKNTSENEVEGIFLEVDKESANDYLSLLKFIPGVRDFILELYRRGTKLAIATTDKSSRAKLALELTDLEKCFDIVLGADNVDNPKPDGEILSLISGEMNISPEKIIMVGDHKVDIETAINAKVKGAIGVSTGLYSLEELDRCNSFNVDNLQKVVIK